MGRVPGKSFSPNRLCRVANKMDRFGVLVMDMYRQSPTVGPNGASMYRQSLM